MVDIEIKPLEELPPIDHICQKFVPEASTYDNINYEDFFNNHMRKNIPCIINNIGSDWESSKKWVNNDKIDFDYLSNKYGTLTVPVTDCKNIAFDNQPRVDMKFSDYISYWKSKTRDKMLYLKDWHLWKFRPEDRFYSPPKLFGSDWLNEYAQDKHLDDFMFVYMGPAGSWTPLHADVYNSFSWSVNVSGRKKWTFFPPGEEEKLKDKFNNVPLRFEPKNFKDKNVTYYEIIQGSGDALFVPSGWYHQVENELDTISVNHNWINGCNIIKVWQGLTRVLQSVKKEISDLKDLKEFPTICQTLLKNLYGMDCEAFVKLITHIGEKRLALIEGGANVAFNNYTLGKNHSLYDLKRIQELMNLITKHSTFVNQEYTVNENFIKLHGNLAYIF